MRTCIWKYYYVAEPPYKQSIEFRQDFFPFSALSKSNFPISYILKGINYWIAEILYSTSFHDIDLTNVRKGGANPANPQWHFNHIAFYTVKAQVEGE